MSDYSFEINDLDVDFTDESTVQLSGSEIFSWHWDFGDGTTSSEQSPAHQYSSSGDYLVCLIAENQCSSDTICQQVTIDPIEGCTSVEACNYNQLAEIDDGSCMIPGQLFTGFWGISQNHQVNDEVGLEVCSGNISLDLIFTDLIEPEGITSVYYVAIIESELNPLENDYTLGYNTNNYFRIHPDSPQFNVGDGLSDITLDMEIVPDYFYSAFILTFENDEAFEVLEENGIDFFLEQGLCLSDSDLNLIFKGASSECGDPSAISFNEDAFCIDNDLCEYDNEGCTYGDACNYDSTAEVEDGSCDYSCYGCTDAEANNYDENATMDNGYCSYGGNLCPGDFTGDGQVNVADLGGFLGAFGESCE